MRDHARLIRQDHGRPIRQGKIQLITGFVQHADRIAKHVGPQRLHGSLGGHVATAELGSAVLKIRIIFLLVSKAAQQAPTNPRNFRRIQKEVLILGHLDGHRLETTQISPAATHLPAISERPDHLGLVAHADLAQFNAGAVIAHQLLDQIPKINPARSREVEDHLALVEIDLHIHKLHVQVHARHALLAVLAGILGQFVILAADFNVFGRGRTINGFDRFRLEAFGQIVAQGHDFAEADPLFGLDQDHVVQGEHKRGGHEKVYLSLASE